MMAGEPNFTQTLYRILPAIYRTRDESGDLRAYLEGCGELLDAVYETLRQLNADNFPDNPPDGAKMAPCQDWLLPYFADLVDARLVSPLPDGRRDELAKAIRWRQGKGTLATMDSVAESIGQTVAVVQEGWSRVATTPRIGQPLRPAVSYGYSREPEAANPGNAARHPDLPAAIIDMRCPSRALASDPDNPGAQTITFEGTSHIWRQGSWHGAPCFPGSYEDVSRRTVDIRTPNWRVGHAHPRRVLAFLPPASGFFPPDAPRVTWNAVPSPAYLDLIEVDDSVPGVITHRNRTLATGAFVPVAIRNVVDFDAAASPAEWRFEGIVFERRVSTATARLSFTRCAARNIRTTLAEMDQPAVEIADSLVNQIVAQRGLVQLVGVTVMRRLAARAVEASECLFQGLITARTNTANPPPRGGCLRYSRIEPAQQKGDMRYFEVTREAAAMVETTFRERHCGVLLPASHDDVLTGAEDEGEIGAFHHARHAAIRAAILTKLEDFLPVGLEAVLIPDSRLTEEPHVVLPTS